MFHLRQTLVVSLHGYLETPVQTCIIGINQISAITGTHFQTAYIHIDLMRQGQKDTSQNISLTVKYHIGDPVPDGVFVQA